MTAYVTVPVAVAANVVKLPNAALRFKPPRMPGGIGAAGHPTVDARTLGARQAQAELEFPRRIGRQLPGEMDRQIDRRQERRQVAEPEPRLGIGSARGEQQRVAGGGRMVFEVRPKQDRKSTRLNSSH